MFGAFVLGLYELCYQAVQSSRAKGMLRRRPYCRCYIVGVMHLTIRRARYPMTAKEHTISVSLLRFCGQLTPRHRVPCAAPRIG